MNRALALAPLLLLAVVVVVSGLVLMRGVKPETITGGDADRPAPSFTLARLGGGAAISDGDFVGKPHLINFFASWCTPCRAEHRQLLALRRQGVTILGVAYKDQPADAASVLNELEIGRASCRERV